MNGLQQGGQVNVTQMNGVAQANGFNQQANGVQVNGAQSQQPNGGAPQQNGQASQHSTRQMQAIVLDRARTIARTQGRSDEQYILTIARALMARFQQQQQERARAQQAVQAQAQQAQAQTQVAGMPGASQVQMPAQVQPQLTQPQAQPQQPSQPQAPVQVPHQPQQPPALPQSQPTPAISSGQPQSQSQPQLQSQPQPPAQVPQQPPSQPQQPQAGPSTLQPQISGPSLSGNAEAPATSSSQTRTTSDPSMAQINNVSQADETSPTLEANGENAPGTMTPSSPHTLNVKNPGPQAWPVSPEVQFWALPAN
ncbi:hypothetical protein BN14_05684 [Rhizoctonia solani AG-1 IB]|uniref:Uncharacterized protein n=1 Tax=Thanatephorus cucumeris (strain AG1-IB / isolate 7/3/14) TaxID=1108050 RepID=M5C710_THACB|nr:hypothetical protein BN14_05684 [Rhizoctonia solani AG-1 IB]